MIFKNRTRGDLRAELLSKGWKIDSGDVDMIRCYEPEGRIFACVLANGPIDESESELSVKLKDHVLLAYLGGEEIPTPKEATEWYESTGMGRLHLVDVLGPGHLTVSEEEFDRFIRYYVEGGFPGRRFGQAFGNYFGVWDSKLHEEIDGETAVEMIREGYME
ncbi:MAG: hypothetical protein V3T26_05920 [candidate division NC10 bacterium]